MRQGLIEPLPGRAHQMNPSMPLGRLVEPVGKSLRGDVVQLADLVDRVLAVGALQVHWSQGRDEPVDAVAPPHDSLGPTRSMEVCTGLLPWGH